MSHAHHSAQNWLFCVVNWYQQGYVREYANLQNIVVKTNESVVLAVTTLPCILEWILTTWRLD